MFHHYDTSGAGVVDANTNTDISSPIKGIHYQIYQRRTPEHFAMISLEQKQEWPHGGGGHQFLM